MVKYKRTSKQHSRLKNVYLIEEKVSLRYIYRYISLPDLTNPIEFKEPSQWPDNFESRFYRANYNPTKYPGFPKKVFALCTTENRDSEAGWKIYKHSSIPLIQIKINRKKFIEYLNFYSSQNRQVVYEGRVSYDLTEAHILNIHKPSYLRIVKGETKNYPVKGHDEIFNIFDMDSYLSLLLLKRDAYKYENEIRYFMVPLGENCSKERISIGRSWKDFVEEIRCSPLDIDEVRKEIKGLNIRLSDFDINVGTYIGDEQITIN